MFCPHQLRAPAMIQSNRGNLHQSVKLENIHEAGGQSSGHTFSMNESSRLLLTKLASVFCRGFSACILLVRSWYKWYGLWQHTMNVWPHPRPHSPDRGKCNKFHTATTTTSTPAIHKNYELKIRNIEKHQRKNRSLYKFILFRGKKPLYLNVKCKFRNVWKFHNLSSTQKQGKKSVATVWQYRNQITDYIQYSGQNLIFNGTGIEVSKFTFVASFNKQQEMVIRRDFVKLDQTSDKTNQ